MLDNDDWARNKIQITLLKLAREKLRAAGIIIAFKWLMSSLSLSQSHTLASRGPQETKQMELGETLLAIVMKRNGNTAAHATVCDNVLYYITLT